MGPVFELFATLGLNSDDFNRGLDDSSKKASGFGDKLKSGLATAAKVGGAAMAAASTAVAGVAKQAVEGFAEYEQLVGGLETMFEDLSYDVEENANKAFQTAGLSANEYMETVMGFSASLNQSLTRTEGNIARAAELSDQIIIDMADNANKMGTSMESIQNAYQGFAKANYTMLDNLKLGYGGTKEEMERLLADATELSGIEFDIDNFSDVAEAIHVIQNEMGITGTTALEASETISGSVASMKSAWQNLIVGMADSEADLSGLIDNVVATAETAFENILPVAEQAITGIATFVEEVAPVIAEKLPGVVETVLPSVLNAATSLVTALVDALPTIMGVLIEQGPVIINTLLEKILEMLPEIVALGLTLLTSLAMGIADNLPELIPTIVEVVMQIVDTLTDPETLGNLIDAAIAIMIALAEGLIEALPKIIERAPEIIENLVTALVENAPKLLKASLEIIVKLVTGLIDNLPQVFEAGGKIVGELISGALDLITDLWNTGKDIVNEIWEGITSLNPIEWGRDLISNFVSGITSKWEDLKSSVRGVAQTVKDFLGFSEPKLGPLSNFSSYAPDMMELFAKGIRDNEHLITDQLNDSFDFQPKIAAAVGSGGVFGADGGGTTTFVFQSTLDGRKIGESVYQYERGRLRAVGG
jgi:phage-related protein